MSRAAPGVSLHAMGAVVNDQPILLHTCRARYTRTICCGKSDEEDLESQTSLGRSTSPMGSSDMATNLYTRIQRTYRCQK